MSNMRFIVVIWYLIHNFSEQCAYTLLIASTSLDLVLQPEKHLNKATFSTKFVEAIIDRYVLKDDLVLDCFNGTGTTLCACIARNIKAIGIELSKKQCEYTVNRITKGVQMNIFSFIS